MIAYLLTNSLYLALFCGCYWLLLRQNTFFGLNRAYLLLSVSLSLLLPVIELPNAWVWGSMTPVNTINLPTFVVGTQNASPDQGLTVDQWILLIYGMGVTLMLCRLGINLRAVFRLIASGHRERQPNYTLVVLPDASGPIPSFSFGHYLVLNATDAQVQPDALMRHEAAHIRQSHTADVLFIEIIRSLFWFNPVLWFYKRALQEVHEFLADRAASCPVAVASPVSPDYARQLVAYALNVSPTALTTPFVSISTLKQRIVMLQKPQTNRRALLGYIFVLPLVALLAMCTQSVPDLAEPEHPVAMTFPSHADGVEGEIFTVVEQQPEFPGGMKNLGAFLSQNLKYPAAAQKVNAVGRVFVNFVVTKTGDISDVRILKDIGFGTGEEAVRVIKLMPRWTPARQSGQLVNVRYNLPINFQLDDVDPSTSTLTPPPPPPLESSTATTTQALNRFTIDGKEVSEEEFSSFPPARIASLNVTTMDPETGKTTGSITTK